ncbi:ECU02_0565 [Encephalitozoon cuniculi GB-M1]|uniref:ECU02_0565 protein n=1 Tax=Encephalitozoon cuniculi (strain GB-M1) TaxID=284813 RepID=I7JTZ2_ENCCU|nr:uncharacterized protein ECU02_0565 [Encephalitozoon cuniculi GB-M1]UYI28247.1 hypothetical protein J0A71_10g21510 [Encephalitozoon cuniculi]CCI73909.1 ECU02_0565 [Encephalitozoon cuniculi GB-M1]
MTSDRADESGRMVEAIEKELVEEIKHKYGEIEKAIEKVIENVERLHGDLLGEIRAVYRGVEESNLM